MFFLLDFSSVKFISTSICNNKWSYTEYNIKNRSVESGEIVLANASTHAQLVASMMKSEVLPSGSKTPLQYIQYGNYKVTNNIIPHAFVATEGYANDYHRLTVGLVTATKTRVLGTDQWITSTVYYDGKCRPVQIASNNLQGSMSYQNYTYDFVGNIIKRQEKHGADVLESVYTYDDRSRLLSVHTTLNGVSQASLAYEYDELGRLKGKLYGSNLRETFSYNVRGWITSKESDAFQMELHYEKVDSTFKCN